MSIYSTLGVAGMSYPASPVPPVNKAQSVNGALQTKTVQAVSPAKSEDVEVLGNGDLSIKRFAAAPSDAAQPMYVDPLTNQRVWSA